MSFYMHAIIIPLRLKITIANITHNICLDV